MLVGACGAQDKLMITRRQCAIQHHCKIAIGARPGLTHHLSTRHHIYRGIGCRLTSNDDRAIRLDAQNIKHRHIHGLRGGRHCRGGSLLRLCGLFLCGSGRYRRSDGGIVHLRRIRRPGQGIPIESKPAGNDNEPDTKQPGPVLLHLVPNSAPKDGPGTALSPEPHSFCFRRIHTF